MECKDSIFKRKETLKMGKLTGKTALITGASCQGIGEEDRSRVFARHGANLILLDISIEIEKLDELGGAQTSLYCR